MMTDTTAGADPFTRNVNTANQVLYLPFGSGGPPVAVIDNSIRTHSKP
jgi:hypothetical protein